MDQDMTPMSNENVNPNGMTEGERISDSKTSSSMTVHKPSSSMTVHKMPNKTKIIVGVVAVGVVAVGVVAYLMTRKKRRKR